MDIERFIEKGYDIFPADDMTKLVELREKILLKATELIGEEAQDPDEFCNNFHKHESI